MAGETFTRERAGAPARRHEPHQRPHRAVQLRPPRPRRSWPSL